MFIRKNRLRYSRERALQKLARCCQCTCTNTSYVDPSKGYPVQRRRVGAAIVLAPIDKLIPRGPKNTEKGRQQPELKSGLQSTLAYQAASPGRRLKTAARGIDHENSRTSGNHRTRKRKYTRPKPAVQPATIMNQSTVSTLQ